MFISVWLCIDVLVRFYFCGPDFRLIWQCYLEGNNCMSHVVPHFINWDWLRYPFSNYRTNRNTQLSTGYSITSQIVSSTNNCTNQVDRRKNLLWEIWFTSSKKTPLKRLAKQNKLSWSHFHSIRSYPYLHCNLYFWGRDNVGKQTDFKDCCALYWSWIYMHEMSIWIFVYLLIERG